MNQEQARIAIMTVLEQIQAEHTDYPLHVEIDNTCSVDQPSQLDPYLEVQLDFLPGGGQKDLGTNPIVQQVGQLLLAAVVKEGTGTSRARRLLDFVTPYFDMVNLSGLETDAVQAHRAKDKDGKVYFPALVDFHYYRRK